MMQNNFVKSLFNNDTKRLLVSLLYHQNLEASVSYYSQHQMRNITRKINWILKKQLLTEQRQKQDVDTFKIPGIFALYSTTKETLY